MNDKQQLAAMGEHMAEQVVQVVQETQAQPLCMAKRIEELEAQVRVMAGLLREAKPYMDHRGGAGPKGYAQLSREIDAALTGKLPEPEGFQTPGAVSVEPPQGKYYPLHITNNLGKVFYVEVDLFSGAVSVGGDAEASEAAEYFMKEIGALAPVIPEGWQLVPVELTKEMGLAADPYAEGKLSRGFMWSDMLAAAPKPEAK